MIGNPANCERFHSVGPGNPAYVRPEPLLHIFAD